LGPIKINDLHREHDKYKYFNCQSLILIISICYETKFYSGKYFHELNTCNEEMEAGKKSEKLILSNLSKEQSFIKKIP